MKGDLRNRSALAVNCWVIIHCLELSRKDDQITSACKYYVSIFYKVWVVKFWTGEPHITQNVKYNSVALLLGYIQVFLHPEVLDFLPIHFPHILSISGKPYLFLWERLDSSIFVSSFQGWKSRVEVSSCSCHLK